MLGSVQLLVLAVRFALELALLGALAAWGWATAGGGLAGGIAGLLAPLVAAVAWGRWIAPKAPHRLRDPRRLALELALFAIGGAALWSIGQPVAGVGLAVASTLTALLTRRVGESLTVDAQ